MGDIAGLGAISGSGGGDLDAAYTTLKIVKSYAKDTTVIVRFMQKAPPCRLPWAGTP